MNRRDALKQISIGCALLPQILSATQNGQDDKTLILIELKGGNDGLNTLIPYSNPTYYSLRPTLAIPETQVLKIDRRFGLHPSMNAIKEMYDKKDVAIIQGVGYPHPNLSHFRSIDIWNTASDANLFLTEGWINTVKKKFDHPLRAVVVGGDYGPFMENPYGIIKISNIQNFLRQSRQIKSRISPVGNNNALLHILRTEREIRKNADFLRRSLPKKTVLPFSFSKTRFGKQMEGIANLIIHNGNIPFYKASIGSFDTHNNQLKHHANLLHDLSYNLGTLRQNLIAKGKWNNTLVMTYSEFGRRASENASRGTDHGTAAPHFLIGGDVKGGFYGDHPSLKKLDKNGNLIYNTDFRSIYNTVATRWLNTSSPLFDTFPTFNIFHL